MNRLNTSTEHRVPVARCLTCGQELDGATQVGGDSRPDPGDYSVCCYCASVAIFTEDHMLRVPTTREAKELRSNRLVQKAVRAILQLRAKEN